MGAFVNATPVDTVIAVSVVTITIVMTARMYLVEIVAKNAVAAMSTCVSNVLRRRIVVETIAPCATAVQDLVFAPPAIMISVLDAQRVPSNVRLVQTYSVPRLNVLNAFSIVRLAMQRFVEIARSPTNAMPAILLFVPLIIEWSTVKLVARVTAAPVVTKTSANIAKLLATRNAFAATKSRPKEQNFPSSITLSSSETFHLVSILFLVHSLVYRLLEHR